jgi:hypothetical protein
MQVNTDKDQVIGNTVNDAALAAFPMRQSRELSVRVIECIRANMEHHSRDVDAQVAIEVKVPCDDAKDAGQQTYACRRHPEPRKNLGQPKPYWPVEIKIEKSLDFARFESRFNLGSCRVNNVCRH